MIERKVLKDRFIEFKVDSFIRGELRDVAVKEVKFERTPLGERIIVYTSTPGLVIGRQGSNIRKLTSTLKNNFKFENPQIKIGEVKDLYLSAPLVAKVIANNLANFGSQKFKLSGFKALTNVMNAGAIGCEIKISGKLPSSRAKSWRFHKGYLKKTGYISDYLVDKAQESVTLKTGVVGVKVQIMLADTPLPDKVIYIEDTSISRNVEEENQKVDKEEETEKLNVEEQKQEG